MNENINLCELLKGHEGEIFYSPAYGQVELLGIEDNITTVYYEDRATCINFSSNGKLFDSGECMLFPSENQRDWNKWAEEQKSKKPKTWDELVEQNGGNDYLLGHGKGITTLTSKGDTPIEKAALALLKIHQLIEVGYGGYPSVEDRQESNNICEVFTYKYPEGYEIDWDEPDDCFSSLIAFHNRELAKEFLSYPENVQLVKDFYQIK